MADQTRNITIPIVDDSVALEADLEFEYQLLGISDSRVRLGEIGTTTLTVTDDDGESIKPVYKSFNT